jgi:YesN/AraC family two-component response regulator
LPLPQKSPTEFTFPPQDEQQLDALVRSGQLQRAVNLAEQILRLNLERGITRAQMEILCVSLTHTAAYAVSGQVPSADRIMAANGVYSTLTSKCVTAREYIETVSNFILSIEEAQTSDVPEQDQLLVRIRQYLKENYYREFSSEEMASDLWVSRSYLSSYYKNKTGMNLSDSIQMFRIQKAVELLKDPNIKIGDVGPMVGMPSSNTFLRQFRKYTGMTPKEYRQKNTE